MKSKKGIQILALTDYIWNSAEAILPTKQGRRICAGSRRSQFWVKKSCQLAGYQYPGFLFGTSVDHVIT